MLVQNAPPLHLSYCLNIHPGERWTEQFHAIRTYTCAVRDRVAGSHPFGLGLRLSNEASLSLVEPDAIDEFKQFLSDENLYVFTINGFPFGAFHGERVKERVYAPDWRSQQRVDYSCRLADLLASLLPVGTQGSISTVPGSFKAWVKSDEDREHITTSLLSCVDHLAKLYGETGKLIHLGLEPEPGCFLEDARESVAFFEDELFRACRDEETVRRHLGVCLDTCHLAIAFENLADSMEAYARAGIALSKIQLSSALRVLRPGNHLSALRSFAEPVYLHQVKARFGERILEWIDLPDALEAWEAGRYTEAEARIHFHVPLFWEGSGELLSTSPSLDAPFVEKIRAGATQHVEIETYTFDVLPAAARSENLEDSIVKEFAWVHEQLGLCCP